MAIKHQRVKPRIAPVLSCSLSGSCEALLLAASTRHLLPPCVPFAPRQSVGDFLDSLGWNLFILALTLYSVFAPDIAIRVSGMSGGLARVRLCRFDCGTLKPVW